MRLPYRVKRAFIAMIVDKTRHIVNSDASVDEKTQALRELAASQDRRIRRIEAQIASMPLPVEREKSYKAISRLRTKVRDHLQGTIEYLLDHDQHPNGLRQVPTVFAVAAWSRKPESRPFETPTPEYPFMEYSS